jgi:Ca-activated chloride channel family protein
MKKVVLVLTLVILAAVTVLSACAAPPKTTVTQTASAPAPVYTTTATAAPTHTSPGIAQPTVTVTAESAPQYSAQQPGKDTVGLSTGGAKDINNFRENIRNDFLPLPTDITYEGLFYDYYFDTGAQQETNKLFSPSYSYAVTRDPLSQQTEYYLSVGLNSGLKEEDFQRKKLNLVIVLDISGSMTSPYDQYYYDQFGQVQDAYAGEGIARLTKMESAKDAVVSILNQLEDYDRFAIVVFNSNASLKKPMGLVRDADMRSIKNSVLDLNAGGSTNLSAGMDKATEQFYNLREVNSYEFENRIIILTDAQPNTGDISSSGMMGTVKRNAEGRIYTTFIGIGVDFNSSLIEDITKTRGANYYSVHSPRDFRERADDEFDFMVTPLIFNLSLDFESDGWRIDKVFGSPEADEATGQLMKINTLFPSQREGGETRGGLVLLKLRKMSSWPNEKIYLRVSYEDRDGRTDSSNEVIYLEGTSPEYFANSGIRKGILLSRYAALLQNWMIDERRHVQYSYPWEPSIDEDTGIIIPPDPGFSQWERQSLPLMVSEPYHWMFRDFSQYFETEMREIGDYTLDQEIEILNILCR